MRVASLELSFSRRYRDLAPFSNFLVLEAILGTMRASIALSQANVLASAFTHVPVAPKPWMVETHQLLEFSKDLTHILSQSIEVEKDHLNSMPDRLILQAMFRGKKLTGQKKHLLPIEKSLRQIGRTVPQPFLRFVADEMVRLVQILLKRDATDVLVAQTINLEIRRGTTIASDYHKLHFVYEVPLAKPDPSNNLIDSLMSYFGLYFDAVTSSLFLSRYHLSAVMESSNVQVPDRDEIIIDHQHHELGIGIQAGLLLYGDPQNVHRLHPKAGFLIPNLVTDPKSGDLNLVGWHGVT